MTEIDTHIRAATETYFDTELGPELLDKLTICEVAGGEWLFRQGDDGDSLYLLVRGRLQVLREDGVSEEHALIGEVVPGESVGEVGLLTGEKRSAGIRAIRDSLLVRIERKPFEELSASNPSLALKLAAHVARLLQRSQARSAAARQFNTITLLPLDNSQRCTAFCRRLREDLAAYGKVLNLAADTLLEQGAPQNLAAGQDPLPGELQHWIHQQETNNRFLVYGCEAGDTPWSRFAVRQSDLVVLIAEPRGEPAPASWELQLAGAESNLAGHRALVLLQGTSDQPITGTAKWLQAYQPDFHLHVRQDRPNDTARVARIIAGQALGLVLGAGGARGFAHLGVYKALRELDVPIDWVGGSSIGSIFGATIAADWSFEEANRTARHHFVKAKPFSDFTLPVAALLRGKRMEHGLQTSLDFNIEDMPVPFFCISSILDSGELNLHETGKLSTALRASAALPAVLPPAVVNRRLSIDGSVLNSLPVDIMQNKPVGRIIAVDLSSHKSYEVEYKDFPSPWAIMAGRLLPFLRKYRVPSLSTTILKATEIGTQAQVRVSGQQADLLLRPPVRKFGLTSVKAYDQVVDAGYHYARTELERWWQTVDSQCGEN